MSLGETQSIGSNLTFPFIQPILPSAQGLSSKPLLSSPSIPTAFISISNKIYHLYIYHFYLFFPLNDILIVGSQEVSHREKELLKKTNIGITHTPMIENALKTYNLIENYHICIVYINFVTGDKLKPLKMT